jgi:hypothetical protein
MIPPHGDECMLYMSGSDWRSIDVRVEVITSLEVAKMPISSQKLHLTT